MCLHSKASLSATSPQNPLQNWEKVRCKLTALELATDAVGPVGAEGAVVVDALGVHRGAGLVDGG